MAPGQAVVEVVGGRVLTQASPVPAAQARYTVAVVEVVEHATTPRRQVLAVLVPTASS